MQLKYQAKPLFSYLSLIFPPGMREIGQHITLTTQIIPRVLITQNIITLAISLQGLPVQYIPIIMSIMSFLLLVTPKAPINLMDITIRVSSITTHIHFQDLPNSVIHLQGILLANICLLGIPVMDRLAHPSVDHTRMDSLMM